MSMNDDYFDENEVLSELEEQASDRDKKLPVTRTGMETLYQLNVTLLAPDSDSDWQKARIEPVNLAGVHPVTIEYPIDFTDANDFAEQIDSRQENRDALRQLTQDIISQAVENPSEELIDAAYIRLLMRLAEEIRDQLERDMEAAHEYMANLAKSRKSELLGYDADLNVEANVKQAPFEPTEAPEASREDEFTPRPDAPKAVQAKLEGEFMLHIGKQSFDLGSLDFLYGITHRPRFGMPGAPLARQVGITSRDLKDTYIEQAVDRMARSDVLPWPKFIFKQVIKFKIVKEINNLSAKELGLNEQRLQSGRPDEVEKLRLVGVAGMEPEQADAVIRAQRKKTLSDDDRRDQEQRPNEPRPLPEEEGPAMGF